MNIFGMAQELAEWKAVDEACEEPEEQERAQIMKQPEKRTPETLVHPLEIWESEAQVICGDSQRWGDDETGGDFYGLYTSHDSPVILLATAAGPKATHEATHFAQDLDFCRRMMGLLTPYGLQPVGAWHAHQSLGIHGPSGGDVRQVMSLTRRNNLRDWLEIITTHPAGWESAASGQNRAVAASDGGRMYTMNAFLYSDPQNGIHERVPIRIIPGVSPYRIAVLLSGKVAPADIAEYALCFPSECITPVGRHHGEDHTEEFPPKVIAELSELPAEAQEGISVQLEDGKAVVTLPVIRGVLAHITFAENPPHEISAIHLEREEDAALTNVMRQVPNAADMSLAEVYHATRTLVQRAAIRSGSQHTRGEGQINWLR